MKPGAHYRQHHEVEEPQIDGHTFRPAWRVATRLDRLLTDGAITPNEWFAAIQFRALAEAACASMWRTPRGPDAPRTLPDPGRTDELDKIARWSMIAQALGDVAYGLLEACVVNDMSWLAIAAQLNVDARTARGWAILAIKALALVEKNS